MRTDIARHARDTLMATACLGVVAMGACKGRASTSDTGRVETPAASDTSAMATPADTGTGATSTAPLTDPNIVALLDEANKADSAAGAFALTKAADPGVKSFAKMMMGEHHALRVEGQALAKKLKVTPEPPTDDPVKTAGASEMDSLRAAGKGAAFDKVYIDQEVAIHKAVLELAEKAHGDTQTAELKALIEKAKPTIQKHLDRAEELQKTLGKAAT
jgi:putative membrane protein